VAFSIQDFHDLIRLLAERPEWRMELRPLILTEELLALPAIVQRLAEAQERTAERVAGLEAAIAALAEAQQRTEQEIRALAEAQRRTEERLNRLEQHLDGVDQRLDGVDQRLDGIDRRFDGVDRRFDGVDRRLDGIDRQLGRLDQHVGELRGSDRERRYRDRASAYFGRLLRLVRVVAAPELDRLLDEGRTTGALDEDAIDDVRWADLIVGGRRPGEESDTYLIVEVSVALDSDDVERAARRAAALGRLRPTLAVVAGDRISTEAAALAKARGVWQMLDGRPVEPGSAG
jgi:hypothetical protein